MSQLFRQQSPTPFLQVVVCTNTPLEQALQYSEVCRSVEPPVPFVYGKTCGVFGQVFCDFGSSFKILDTDGAMLFAPHLHHHICRKFRISLRCTLATKC